MVLSEVWELTPSSVLSGTHKVSLRGTLKGVKGAGLKGPLSGIYSGDELPRPRDAAPTIAESDPRPAGTI